MGEKIDYFKQIEAMHQTAREFVEKEHPDFKVVDVSSYPVTSYCPPMHSIVDDLAKLEYVLYDMRLRFRVEAENLSNLIRLTCEVFVTTDGQLIMRDQRLSR